MIANIFDWIDGLSDWQFALAMGVLALVGIAWVKWIDKRADD